MSVRLMMAVLYHDREFPGSADLTDDAHVMSRLAETMLHLHQGTLRSITVTHGAPTDKHAAQRTSVDSTAA